MEGFPTRQREAPITFSAARPRTLAATTLGLAALLLISGCSGGLSAREESLGGPSPAPATGMPDPSALTPAGSVVPSDTWAVVQIADDSGEGAKSTLALKAGLLRVGDADDLKDLKVMNGTSNTAVGTPYYINYAWVVLEGSENASPVQSITAVDSASGETGNTLLVPAEYEKCSDPVTGQFGGTKVVNVECSVDVFPGEVMPDRLVFDGDPADYKGTSAVQLAIPKA
ncbi:hypothetical protein B7R21_14865 [Subtercola boreus]|uniref:Uncharacterized protein n=1 Tax=Subtercola boreus TaxID=120213 RepID=A0A3E0VD46_9MICO|nr:hypothetical protein B7R21_14865 [Subtercola boreus]